MNRFGEALALVALGMLMAIAILQLGGAFSPPPCPAVVPIDLPPVRGV